ncbi:MAG TPA: branched-chain amino acid ABC transporter permease, partial [Thermoleophilia bacterium]|nr:branched-chain amino acid ABC transporter permease [Thermoleophilia bacterium]
LMWGNNTQVLRAGIDVVYNFAGFHVTQGQIVEAVAASLTLLAVFSWLWHTEIGLQFRALASNPPLLAVMGRDVRRIRRLVFALSGVLAALASVTTALDVGFDPNVGMRAILVGVAATIVGGRTSFVGAAVAGVFFGILRAQVVWHASARWEDAATFAVLATFLFLLPGGLHSLTVGKTRLEEQR